MQPVAGVDPRRTPSPQPWTAVRYPAPAMVMQHPMMAPPPPPPYGHPFVPYPHPPTPPPQPPSKSNRHQQGDEAAAEDEKRTIWVGDLQYWMDENYLLSCFVHTGEVVSIKVIRNKQTGQSEGYGFVEFHSHATAEKILQSFSGHLMPTTDLPFRLNWASFSMGNKRSDLSFDHSIFVGGLGPDGASATGSQSDIDSANTTVFVGGLDPEVSEDDLKEAFSQYGEITSVKIPVGKQCGFVLFAHRNNAEEALQQLNGTIIGKQTVRLSWGRNPARQSRAERSKRWNGVYFGGQAYDGYGLPPHYPGMYTVPYGAYAYYGNQQQVN
ncbi:polyadenylate-binding protein RBP47C-like isoform X2 [Musa acuminata AAA Group]|uniref:polyadenylate-binding protein RBP47C isoform X2 n=1 Tax=Musa acuminata AAA Group TaxID=214697 RepID=UPI0031CE05EB